MGRFFDTGQEAFGFIAIGQFATGFFALGQVATGVIAIGQVARGVVVIGQAAIGLVGVGMLSTNLIFSVGMLGVGGRGLGGILPLVPRLRAAERPPEVTSFAAIAGGGVPEGWVDVTLAREADRSFTLHADGGPTPVRLDARLRRAAERVLGAGPTPRLLALIRRQGADFVCDRLMKVPPSRLTSPHWWGIWAAQTALLVVAAILYWFLVARPVIDSVVKILS